MPPLFQAVHVHLSLPKKNKHRELFTFKNGERKQEIEKQDASEMNDLSIEKKTLIFKAKVSTC
jgi:hypothetical protein